MTSRERVALALSHREPDRVPVDLGSQVTTGIMVSAYAKLRQKLGVDHTPPKISDILWMVAEVERPVMEKLGCDVIGLFPTVCSFGLANTDWKPWRLFDGTDVLVPGGFEYRIDDNGDILVSPRCNTGRPASARMPNGGHYFDTIVRQQPLDWDHLDPAEFAEQFTRYSDEALSYLQKSSEAFYQTTDYALLGNFGAGGLGDLPLILASDVVEPKGIRNYDDWLAAHLTHPEYIKGVHELQTQRALENLELYRQAVGDRISVLFMSGADFGTQRQELISPDMYRELYFPFHRRLNDWVHQHTSWKVLFHCCGSVYHLIPGFIEAGVDILNPVQCSAANMQPERLKREFGGKLVFWGGAIDSQTTLPFGTPEEVRREVTERIRIFAPGGGYVVNPIHNIQVNTPVENILAVYETARAVGTYPIA